MNEDESAVALTALFTRNGLAVKNADGCACLCSLLLVGFPSAPSCVHLKEERPSSEGMQEGGCKCQQNKGTGEKGRSWLSGTQLEPVEYWRSRVRECLEMWVGNWWAL